MARGHFEVFPQMIEAWGAAPAEPTGDFGWRFRDQDGHLQAASPGGYPTPGEAKVAVAEFVRKLREATYGQRFEGEIADAVIEVDE